MATKDWVKNEDRNPYVTHSWFNKKKRLLLQIHYDIGFDKQRNATVYDLSQQTYEGFKDLATHYGESEKDALHWAKLYMETN